MAKINIHAGDFGKGKAEISFALGENLVMLPPAAPGKFSLTGYGKSEMVVLAEIDAASEESVKRIGGTVGWGLVGGVLLGPVGLLAGLLAGGNKQEITFVAKFKDDRRMLATTDSKTYTKLAALVF